MIVVSDSTTLIILQDLDKLCYLQNIFKTIFIPPKVSEEINFKSKINLPNYIKVIAPKNIKQIEELKYLLDDGEREAIALSVEKNLPLIIDEKKGRKIAKNLNIDILGLLGVLYLNIKKDFLTISEAEEFLQNAKNSGYRILDKLINQMIERAREISKG